MMALLVDALGGHVTHRNDEMVVQPMGLLLAVTSTISSLAGKRRVDY